MKFKNVILVLFLCALCISTVKADVSAPSTFTVRGNDLASLQGSSFLPSGVSTTLRFSYKMNSAGQLVYCTEADDSMVSAGSQETYTRSTKVTNDRILYVLINGLNGTTSSNTYKQADYFATGIAVWYVLDSNNWHVSNFNVDNGTYKGYSNDVTKKVASLVNNSKGYTYKDPTLSVSSKNVKLTSSKDGKSYVTSELGVTVTGYVGDYTVTLKNQPNGTKILGTDGKEKTTFKTSEKFKISVPSDSIDKLETNFTVNISATGTEYAAYNYTAAISSHQNLVSLYKNNKSLSASIDVSLNLSSEVSISKQDATTGKELPGATLVLKKSDGTEVTSWKSTNEPKVIKNLDPGTYTLTETIAPDGYVKSSETVTFTINSNGQLVGGPVVMKNYPKGSVYISKQSATTGEEVSGAKLVLTNSDGEEVASWTSGTKPHEIKNLPAGKYTLTETIAPQGYIKSSETVTFTVKADGTTDGTVIMKNKPEVVKENPKTGTVAIIIAWVVGLSTLVYAYYYFTKIRKNES